jgi:hypothetical protein
MENMHKKKKLFMVFLFFTPLRILNAHGNVAFALINRPRMGDLIVQMCKMARSNHTKTPIVRALYNYKDDQHDRKPDHVITDVRMLVNVDLNIAHWVATVRVLYQGIHVKTWSPNVDVRTCVFFYFHKNIG